MVSELSLPSLPSGFNIAHSFADKLDRKTYLSWKAQFLAILAIHDLSFILDPSSPIPPTHLNEKPNPAFAIWTKIDILVLSWIRATASSSIQPLIFSCSSALDAWSTLEKRLSPNSRVHIKSLRERLRNLKKDASTSMLDYLLTAKTISDELAATGNSIPDSDLIEFVTDGLGSEYRGLISALALQPSLSFDDVFDILLHEESLLNRHSSSSSSGTALSTTMNDNKGHRHGHPSRGRGTRGRWRPRGTSQATHYRPPQQHHLPPLLPTPPSPILPRDACQICNTMGHSARVCPQRHNHAYASEISDTMSSVSLFDPGESNWCLDSGASHHMTPTAHRLQNVQPHSTNAGIIVGNGQVLPIHSSGDLSFLHQNRNFLLSNILCVPSLRKNLLSIQKFCKDNNCYFLLDDLHFSVKDKVSHQLLLSGPSRDGLYHLNAPQASLLSSPQAHHSFVSSPDVWHRRLGHPASPVLQKVLSHAFPNKTFSQPSLCSHCKLAKAT